MKESIICFACSNPAATLASTDWQKLRHTIHSFCSLERTPPFSRFISRKRRRLAGIAPVFFARYTMRRSQSPLRSHISTCFLAALMDLNFCPAMYVQANVLLGIAVNFTIFQVSFLSISRYATIFICARSSSSMGSSHWSRRFWFSIEIFLRPVARYCEGVIVFCMGYNFVRSSIHSRYWRCVGRFS